MLPEELDNDEYRCLCGLHSHTGALIFFIIAILVSIGNICRGIFSQDDFYTVFSLIDIGVIVLAIIGNRFKSKSLYKPFFAVRLILTFSLSVISVLLFIKLYERTGKRRNFYNSQFIDQNDEYSRPMFLSCILILLVHGYALKVIYRSYLYMGELKKFSKTDINALKVLIERERHVILARAEAKRELLSSPIDL